MVKNKYFVVFIIVIIAMLFLLLGNNNSQYNTLQGQTVKELQIDYNNWINKNDTPVKQQTYGNDAFLYITYLSIEDITDKKISVEALKEVSEDKEKDKKVKEKVISKISSMTPEELIAYGKQVENSENMNRYNNFVQTLYGKLNK